MIFLKDWWEINIIRTACISWDVIVLQVKVILNLI